MARILILLALVPWLAGCMNTVWTGATLVYDRHNLYKKMSDFQLAANAGRALYKDTALKCKHCSLDLAVFNGDLLLAGHVPSQTLYQEAERRLRKLPGYRRMFIQVDVLNAPGNAVEDSWITAKIWSAMVADSDINPKKFKIVTSDNIVYLMGDVIPSQAKKVILIARQTSDVKRVVKLFKYYHLSNKDTLQ